MSLRTTGGIRSCGSGEQLVGGAAPHVESSRVPETRGKKKFTAETRRRRGRKQNTGERRGGRGNQRFPGYNSSSPSQFLVELAAGVVAQVVSSHSPAAQRPFTRPQGRIDPGDALVTSAPLRSPVLTLTLFSSASQRLGARLQWWYQHSKYEPSDNGRYPIVRVWRRIARRRGAARRELQGA